MARLLYLLIFILMWLGKQLLNPRIKEKELKDKFGKKFIGYSVTFGKSITAFDKVCFSKEEARAWIIQVNAILPGVNKLHSAIIP